MLLKKEILANITSTKIDYKQSFSVVFMFHKNLTKYKYLLTTSYIKLSIYIYEIHHS